MYRRTMLVVLAVCLMAILTVACTQDNPVLEGSPPPPTPTESPT